MASERLFDRIFGTLSFRKIYHFIGGIFIFLTVYFLEGYPIFIIGLIYLAAFWFFGKRISFAVIAVLILYVITGSKFATLGAVLIFTIGDGLAAVVGSKFGRRTWMWHDHKTIAGSLAFLISSTIAMTFFATWSLPTPRSPQWPVVFIPVLIGCFLECLPISIIRGRKPDDNLILITSTGLLLYIIQETILLNPII